MEVTIITSTEYSLDPTRYFGILLSKSLSVIHMLHWYAKDYNVHEILGDLYEDLDNLFDKFQEEIIGTSKQESVLFPSFSPDSFTLDKPELFAGDHEEMMEVYHMTAVKLSAIFLSRELANYIDSVSSGLNNTKEDIISRINKANYLLGMIRDND